jgi:hypothetical protein
LDDTERQMLGVRTNEWQGVVRGLFLASRVSLAASMNDTTDIKQEVLFSSDFLLNHCLEHLQCIM